MMLVIALSASISFSSCSSDDDDASSSSSGGGASAASVPGSYTGITSDDSNKLTAIFAEDGTGVINENSKQISFTYSMAGETGIVNARGGYKYTLRFIEGFMLLEESDGYIPYIFYRTGQDLGSPNPKKLVGNWENKYEKYGRTREYNYTFNSDGTGASVETDNDGPKKYVYNYTLKYKIVNAYVAKGTEWEDVKPVDDPFAAIVLNNKLYLLFDYVSPGMILSKK